MHFSPQSGNVSVLALLPGLHAAMWNVTHYTNWGSKWPQNMSYKPGLTWSQPHCGHTLPSLPRFVQLILLNPRNAALKYDVLHSKSSLFHAEQIIKHVIIKVPSYTIQQSFSITEFQTRYNSTLALPCAQYHRITERAVSLRMCRGNSSSSAGLFATVRYAYKQAQVRGSFIYV